MALRKLAMLLLHHLLMLQTRRHETVRVHVSRRWVTRWELAWRRLLLLVLVALGFATMAFFLFFLWWWTLTGFLILLLLLHHHHMMLLL